MKCPECGAGDDAIYEVRDVDTDEVVEDSLGNVWFECDECGEQGIASDFESKEQ